MRVDQYLTGPAKEPKPKRKAKFGKTMGLKSLAKHTPGGQSHEQSLHGSWARGTSASQLASDMFTEGGFTVNIKTGERPKSGFSVALTPYNRNFTVASMDSPQAAITEIQSYIRTNYAALTAPGAHFGGWFDSETGTFHLDVAMVAPDLDSSFQVAATAEKAVYNLGTGETIPNPNYDGRYG